jgi:hypothetical protein
MGQKSSCWAPEGRAQEGRASSQAPHAEKQNQPGHCSACYRRARVVVACRNPQVVADTIYASAFGTPFRPPPP